MWGVLHVHDNIAFRIMGIQPINQEGDPFTIRGAPILRFKLVLGHCPTPPASSLKYVY